MLVGSYKRAPFPIAQRVWPTRALCPHKKMTLFQIGSRFNWPAIRDSARNATPQQVVESLTRIPWQGNHSEIRERFEGQQRSRFGARCSGINSQFGLFQVTLR